MNVAGVSEGLCTITFPGVGPTAKPPKLVVYPPRPRFLGSKN